MYTKLAQCTYSPDNKTRLNKIYGIRGSWVQQDTHTTKRGPTHSINNHQQIQQQHHQHKARLTDKQRQTTSYNQWIQQREQMVLGPHKSIFT